MGQKVLEGEGRNLGGEVYLWTGGTGRRGKESQRRGLHEDRRYWKEREGVSEERFT